MIDPITTDEVRTCLQRALPLLIAVVLSSMALACSSSDERPSSLGSTGDASVNDAHHDADIPDGSVETDVTDAGCEDCADACEDCEDGGTDANDAVWIPATEGSYPALFDLSAAGAGESRLDELLVSDNIASLTLVGAPHRGFAYTSHEWTAAGYTLFDVISIAEDGSDFAVTYLYCSGTELLYAYTESFLHPMDWETTTGSCDYLMESRDTPVDLPALNTVPTAIDTGVSIQGTGIDLGPLGGSIEVDGALWELIPFNTVDCTDCPDGPWYEVHSMLRKANEGCFGILYLYPDAPNQVELGYAICLPSLDQPYQMYDATWSGAVPAQLMTMPWRPPWL
jgi:hypothetical protein